MVVSNKYHIFATSETKILTFYFFMSMKKIMNLVLAAILICGATLFSSCSTDDNPVNPADNLAEKIIGKWIETDII